jgi:APA family basic amino acid/polyamine antiporter
MPSASNEVLTHSSRAIDSAGPRRTIGLWDAVAMVVGIVIGSGIFRLPSLVAGNVDGPTLFLVLWVAGGVISFIGALVYSELASSFPSAGGDYHFLMRAYGRPAAFLFAWARMTVMQTGSIALVAFVFGDYASQLVALGPFGSSIYAAAAIVVLTAVNVVGTWQGKTAQNLLTILIAGGLLGVVAVALTSAPVPSAGTGGGPVAVGGAMILILLTYGGWNEGAYLSGEIKDVRRNMVRALMFGLGIVTVIYVAVNYAYLRVLGLEGVRNSQAVGADLMRATLGEWSAIVLSVLVSAAALSTLNATIFTGARTNFALGRDFALFGHLGRWKLRGDTPANALLVQGVIALALVVLGTSVARGGVQTMVDYTAPVFWFFFLMTGVALFILRRQSPESPQPFRVPLYPVTPLLFCATCAYMLYSSLTFTGPGAAIGVAIVAAGLPVLLIASSKQRSSGG